MKVFLIAVLLTIVLVTLSLSVSSTAENGVNEGFLEKRTQNFLSQASCLRLKKNGYCRYPVIKYRLCNTVCCEMKMDFENGIDNWTKTGTAFNNQPTYGDNPKYRNRESAQQQGNWWIGGYENRSSPSHPAGKVQGDGLTGTLTSPMFRIKGKDISFLIGGGCDITQIRVELLVGGVVVKKETGRCYESMQRQHWNVSAFQGQLARVRLVDQGTGSWGHINFDDLRADICV